MDGNSFIGFCWHEVKAYCKRCETTFKYGYNSAGRGIDSGDNTCPICHKNDMVETNQHIDTHIQMLRGFSHSNLMSEESKKIARKEINDLLKIQRIWLAEQNV